MYHHSRNFIPILTERLVRDWQQASWFVMHGSWPLSLTRDLHQLSWTWLLKLLCTPEWFSCRHLMSCDVGLHPSLLCCCPVLQKKGWSSCCNWHISERWYEKMDSKCTSTSPVLGTGFLINQNGMGFHTLIIFTLWWRMLPLSQGETYGSWKILVANAPWEQYLWKERMFQLKRIRRSLVTSVSHLKSYL